MLNSFAVRNFYTHRKIIMKPEPKLQSAMLRMAYAERQAKASLAGGNNIRASLLELTIAAANVRHIYMTLLEESEDYLKSEIENLKTHPCFRKKVQKNEY